MIPGELHLVRLLFQMNRQDHCGGQLLAACSFLHASPLCILCLQGAYNNQSSVAQNVVFEWLADTSVEEVYVTGDFNGWVVSQQFQHSMQQSSLAQHADL